MQRAGRAFEESVRELWIHRYGPAVIVGGKGDGGIDIRGYISEIPVIIQCKSNLAGPSIVRELEGSMAKHVGIGVLCSKGLTRAGILQLCSSKHALVFMDFSTMPSQKQEINRVDSQKEINRVLVNRQCQLKFPSIKVSDGF
jgi:hypothetical protein